MSIFFLLLYELGRMSSIINNHEAKSIISSKSQALIQDPSALGTNLTHLKGKMTGKKRLIIKSQG